MRTTLGILGIGNSMYRLAAWQGVQAALKNFNGQVVLGSDIEVDSKFIPNRFDILKIHKHQLDARSAPFLTKFLFWQQILARYDFDIFIAIDADAAIINELNGEMLATLMGPCGVGMVEQTQILGSQTFGKEELYAHYKNITHKFIAPDKYLPSISNFTFYNSGFISFQRTALEEFLQWFNDIYPTLDQSFQMENHMIADQDFLQIWTNALNINSAKTLPWIYNHCQWWDKDFPNQEATVVHLSNFCEGVTADALNKLGQLTNPDVFRSGLLDDITIVTVTHNSAAVLPSFFEWLSWFPSNQIVIVDNDSSDESRNIASKFGANVVESNKNVGFARAINMGFTHVRTKYICFLNPDSFLTLQACSEALRILHEDDEKIASPIFMDAQGQTYCGIQPGYTREKLMLEALEILPTRIFARWRSRLIHLQHDSNWFWSLGTSMFMSRQNFESLGGFDENYFLYMEDVEFGKKSIYQNSFQQMQSLVLHLGGSSTSTKPSRLRTQINQARLRYAYRHYGRFFALRFISTLAMAKFLSLFLKQK